MSNTSLLGSREAQSARAQSNPTTLEVLNYV